MRSVGSGGRVRSKRDSATSPSGRTGLNTTERSPDEIPYSGDARQRRDYTTALQMGSQPHEGRHSDGCFGAGTRRRPTHRFRALPTAPAVAQNMF